MVNRILIRVKVVQMLYAYLLTRSEFRIDSAPEAPSRDKRFAYSVYLDLLQLIIELSGCNPQRKGNKQPVVLPPKLNSNRVGKALADTDAIKSAMLRGAGSYEAVRECVPALAGIIEESAVYTDYAKRRKLTLDDDVKLWTSILSTIIAKSEAVEKAFRTSDDFSQVGYEAGIRQAIDTLEAYNDSRAAYRNAQSDLQRSLDTAYSLYHHLFGLMIELTNAQADRIETAKRKYLATDQDRNPNTRFITNALVTRLKENEGLQKYLKDHPMRWADEPALIKKLLDNILASDTYREYMESPERSYEGDCNLWRNLLKNVIITSDDLAEELENRSIFWNDDLEIMATFVLKTIGHFAKNPDEPVELLPEYKDEEDAAFGAELFSLAVENRELYREYIDKFINSDQWDPERLAFMDIVIMTCAIAELMNYPAIPVPVTMNEYVEIANNYSTQRSGQFINGILYAVVTYLQQEGILKKN